MDGPTLRQSARFVLSELEMAYLNHLLADAKSAHAQNAYRANLELPKVELEIRKRLKAQGGK